MNSYYTSIFSAGGRDRGWEVQEWSEMGPMSSLAPVCGKDTPSERTMRGKTGFQNTKSEYGEQVLPLNCPANASRGRSAFLSQTPVTENGSLWGV